MNIKVMVVTHFCVMDLLIKFTQFLSYLNKYHVDLERAFYTSIKIDI